MYSTTLQPGKKKKVPFLLIVIILLFSLVIITGFIFLLAGGTGLIIMSGFRDNSNINPVPSVTEKEIISYGSPVPVKTSVDSTFLPTIAPTATSAPERVCDSVYFLNGIDEKVWVIVYYKHKDEWKIKDWVGIDPGEKKHVFDTTNRYFYYYAESETYVWQGEESNENDIEKYYDENYYYMIMKHIEEEEFTDFTVTLY